MAARPKAGFLRTQGPGAIPPPPEGWTPRAKNAEEVVAVVERLPLEPGVYIMRDHKGRVIYVGKARKLRNRVRQYFNGHDTRDFVPLLGRVVGDIETVITVNDKEALLLENNLIKLHRPRFNVKLRDDKQYLVLRLDPRKAWPRLEVVRNIAQDGARYYGPFHSASRARSTLRVVNRHFQLRTCTDHVLKTRTRPCLQYQIGRCPAPCVYEVDAESYRRQVNDVGLFLSGKHEELTRGLYTRMQEAAEATNFESAAAIRDQLSAIETTLEGQQVVNGGEGDQDLVGLYREGGQVEFALMHVRSGKLIASSNFSQTKMEMPDADLVRGLLGAYYDNAPFIPAEVLLPVQLAPDDLEPLAEWLSEKRGGKVHVLTPQRGDKVRLVSLANKNAASNFVSRRNRARDSEHLLSRLQDRFSLSRLPKRIECFDVSHIQGSDAVASMVVFQDGEPDKKAYRSFKIKGSGGELAQGSRQNDDFASMYEVLSRRFRRALDAKDESWALPDLMVIDGGKGQLGRVLAAMDDLGIPLGVEGLDVISLAKERVDQLGYGKQALERLAAQDADHVSSASAVSEPGRALGDYEVARARKDHAKDGSKHEARVRPERVFVPGAKDAIALAPASSERYLLERLRDEAHRFAITHHRKRRGKRSLESSLDKVPGVGPALKRKLIAHFGRIAAIRGADVEALMGVPGVGPKLAQRLVQALGGPGKPSDGSDLAR